MNAKGLQQALFIMVMALFIHTTATAADWERIMMPGEVIEGHAEYEAECKRCHVRFSKGSQNELCKDCHEKVADDLDQKTGYHGRHTNLTQRDCKSCHTDHQGRDADIVRLNTEIFDHALTDFPLEGQHQGTGCPQCHEAHTPYRDAAGQCVDCHSEQDPHRGNLGEQCADCHSAGGWQEIRFDHDDTDFRLTGGHRDSACNACHLAQKYENTPDDCIACHRSNDVHAGRNGEACADCHTTARWDESRFDHDRDTEYSLQGRHSDIRCEACHTRPVQDAKPATECYACHRSDDDHQGRFGRECDTCHQEDGWNRTRFNHNRDTDYPLRGRHEDASCTACHKTALDDGKTPDTCLACHRGDDAHDGQQGEQCQQCHIPSGWDRDIAFDHDLTRFPLIGLHATAPCEECHLSGRFQDAPGQCLDCHGEEDVHDSSMGDACGLCHNPNAWILWQFDHDTSTDFTLDGAHADLACEACHDTSLKVHARTSGSCQGCHQGDDVHNGDFGRNCARCHTTESFQDVRMLQ